MTEAQAQDKPEDIGSLLGEMHKLIMPGEYGLGEHIGSDKEDWVKLGRLIERAMEIVPPTQPQPQIQPTITSDELRDDEKVWVQYTAVITFHQAHRAGWRATSVMIEEVADAIQSVLDAHGVPWDLIWEDKPEVYTEDDPQRQVIVPDDWDPYSDGSNRESK